MESLFETAQPAPLLIGEFFRETQTTVTASHVPKLLSFLATRKLRRRGPGTRPHGEGKLPPVSHSPAFQIMIAIGTFLAFLEDFRCMGYGERRDAGPDRRMLRIIALSGPLGFIALEAGWTVTETGRQPLDHPGRDEDRGRRHTNARPGLSDDVVTSSTGSFLVVTWLDGEAVSKCG